MRNVNVLCVCGSGTATSAMLAAKIRDVLEEHGYDCDTDETNPPGSPHCDDDPRLGHPRLHESRRG